MYTFKQRPATSLTNEAQEAIQQISQSAYVVLVGRNNSGKSYLLKQMAQTIGNGTTTYLGPARYQNFNVFGTYQRNSDKLSEKRQQEAQNLASQQQQNQDTYHLNLAQSIAELGDRQREKLTEIVLKLLHVKLEYLDTIPGNSMSPKYISCNGHNLSFTSSGFRLVTALIASLLDTDFSVFLIDEPELGISPEAQGVLADFLFDPVSRAKYFSHINTIVFATHSTVFLDRNTITNNYFVSKTGDAIDIKRVQLRSEFNNIHFFLLGNRFETLYLPSAIILVEGICDFNFITRFVALKHQDLEISVISANTDNKIKEIVHTAKGIFLDLQKSPYHDRIIVVIDSVHGTGLVSHLERMGIAPSNIVVWKKNGIEFYYPPALVDQEFGPGAEITITGDIVERNRIRYNKGELGRRIVANLLPDTQLHPDFIAQFGNLLDARLGKV